ncbi:MAG: hypothetical protein AABY75_05595 [Bacteroidota bacterium]
MKLSEDYLRLFLLDYWNLSLKHYAADWSRERIVQEIASAVAEFALPEIFMEEDKEDLTAECESPIEHLLANALSVAPIEPSSIGCQVEIADICRADFLVEVYRKPNHLKIAVFCDGHDYHERTKEQAARDRRIDRELQDRGVVVMRFTGSEIYKDAHGCAYAIARMAWKLKHGGDR